MIEFLDMGGYGRFVWSAYGIWLAVMLINYIYPIIKQKNTIQKLLKRQRTK